MIRGLLLNPDIQISDVTELLLFSSARSELVVQKIIPCLNNNIIVLLDRFYDSTVAYQGFGRGSMPIDQIHALNATASHGLTPDITFFLDIDINGAYKRRANQSEDRMEKSGQAFYERVRDGYHFLAKNNKRFVTLDAQLPPEDIHFEIWKFISARMQSEAGNKANPKNKQGKQKNRKPESGSEHDGVEKETVAKWVTAQPFVIFIAMECAQSHSYMSMQNGHHKRQCKDE